MTQKQGRKQGKNKRRNHRTKVRNKETNREGSEETRKQTRKEARKQTRKKIYPCENPNRWWTGTVFVRFNRLSGGCYVKQENMSKKVY